MGHTLKPYSSGGIALSKIIQKGTEMEIDSKSEQKIAIKTTGVSQISFWFTNAETNKILL